MILVQILVGNLHKGHLGSNDIIQGNQQVFANNSRLKRATDTCMVSLCLSCQDESPDVQHALLGSTCDLGLRSNFDLTFQGHKIHVSTRFHGRNTMVLALSR